MRSIYSFLSGMTRFDPYRIRLANFPHDMDFEMMETAFVNTGLWMIKEETLCPDLFTHTGTQPANSLPYCQAT